MFYSLGSQPLVLRQNAMNIGVDAENKEKAEEELVSLMPIFLTFTH